MRRSASRVAAVMVVVAAAACGAFGADDEEKKADAGADDAGGDVATVPDGGPAEAGVDAAVEACTPPCAASLFATMNEEIRSLACPGGAGGNVYVGLQTEIRSVAKSDGASTVAASFTARHIAMDAPIVFSSGEEVRRNNGGNQLVADGQVMGARGVAATQGAIYWGHRAPDQVYYWPKTAPMPDGGLLLASLPALGEGMLVRGNTLHVAIPSMNRVASIELDGGATGEDIVTNDDVYAIANGGGYLYWIADTARMVRYVAWNATETVMTLVDATGTVGKMEGICVDMNHVYFSVGSEVHRVPRAP